MRNLVVSMPKNQNLRRKTAIEVEEIEVEQIISM